MTDPIGAAQVAAATHVGSILPKGAARPQMTAKPKPPRKTGCPVTRIRHGQVQHCSKPKGHDGDHGSKGVAWRSLGGDAA